MANILIEEGHEIKAGDVVVSKRGIRVHVTAWPEDGSLFKGVDYGFGGLCDDWLKSQFHYIEEPK